MLRQAAFIANNKMLKGALHCHTTRSDGKGTPEEVMRLHKEHGYDFMAITDHRLYNYKCFAPETGITVIPGMEMDGNMPGSGIHCFHEVCIGPAKADGNGYEQDQRLESVHVNDQDEFQPTLDAIHANGNMTIYCHPQWSNTPAHEFDRLQGNFAMEIWNSGCVILDDMDSNNDMIWDELLVKGVKLWAVATDDGHGMAEHCNGWVMVNAANDVNSILRALKNGAFYASTGPEIYDFRIESGNAIVECSECEHITFYFGVRPGGMIRNADGTPVKKGMHEVMPYAPYIRASVVDCAGHRAWTNPIFLDRK